ncbi:putative membrane protein YfcA [Planomicrobium sp. HSC-17F08]|nr:putative membrane protein YfcA [Planomicrobium sp. HSC-17F08]
MPVLVTLLLHILVVARAVSITFILSYGSTGGKIVADQLLYGFAAVMILTSIGAATLGQKMNTKYVQ